MSVFMLVVKFLPLVIVVIRELENIFPQAGFGPFKLSVAINLLSHIYDLLGSGSITKDVVVAKLPDLISALVAEMNKKPESWVDPAAPVAAAVPAAKLGRGAQC